LSVSCEQNKFDNDDIITMSILETGF